MSDKNKIVLVFGDVHAPFINPKFFGDLKRLIAFYHPSHIVNTGDLVDSHSISRSHRPEAEAKSPLQEWQDARDCVGRLVEIMGNIPVSMVEGNHDIRITRQAADVKIPQQFLKPYKEMYNIPEHWKVAGRIVHNDVLYCHGISPITHKATLAFNKNVIQGHYHAMLGINYITTPVKKMFSGYTGGCCNDKAIAMRYAKDNLNKSAYGVIVIINKIPQVVPL